MEPAIAAKERGYAEMSLAVQESVLSPQSLTESSRWLRGVCTSLLVVAATTATLVAAEVGFRIVAPQSIVPRYVEASDYGIRKNIGNVRGMMMTSEYQHQFTTNSQGFRGSAEYRIPKPSGVFRMIVLGDSVTLGHGVEDGETFAAVAELALSRSGPVEVINMGISGFGTAEELIQLQQVGARYQPDVVVLAYFPNDPYNNVVSRLFSVEDGRLVRKEESFAPALFIRDHLSDMPGYSFLCQHSHVMNFVRSRFSAFFMDRLGKKYQSSVEIKPELTPTERVLTESLIKEILQTATVEQGVPLVILNIPVILDNRVIQNFPVEALDQTDVSTLLVDVEHAIYNEHRLDELSYPNDAHPKPLAHRLIGEELARVVRARFWQD